MNVLVIAAHYDDEVLACGGTIEKHVQKGDKVHVLFLTDSVSTQYYNDKKKQKERYKDMIKSSKILGFTFSSGNLKDMELNITPIWQVAIEIKEQIDYFKPERIYTHFRYDLNDDHATAFKATMIAARRFSGDILSYYYGKMELGAFKPDYFNFIEYDAWEKKEAAFKAYAMEHRKYPHPFSGEGLQIWSMFWSFMSGYVENVEPFLTIRRMEI